MAREFWRRWLLAVVAGTVLFGLVMAVLPGVAEWAFARMIFGTAKYPFGAIEGSGAADPAGYARFATAVLGAVMAGWGVVMGFLVAIPLRRGEPWAWWALLAGLAVWFVADGGASLALGYGENALLNLGITVAFVPGLVGTRPARPAA